MGPKEDSASPDREITFYESWDYDFVIACVTTSRAAERFFRLSEKKEALTWEYVPWNSPLWDSIHQNLFRNFRGERITDENRLANLPPVPPIPDGPEPTAESYYLPDKPLLAAQFPLLCAEMSRRGTRQAVLRVVLDEDGYESRYGDGKMLLLHDAFLTPPNTSPPNPAVPEELPQENGAWTIYHTRYLTVFRVGDVLEFPSFKLGTFEHYEPARAIQKCEDHLAQDN